MGQVVESKAGRNRLPVEFPDDESVLIFHEAIYQALYINGAGFTNFQHYRLASWLTAVWNADLRHASMRNRSPHSAG